MTRSATIDLHPLPTREWKVFAASFAVAVALHWADVPRLHMLGLAAVVAILARYAVQRRRRRPHVRVPVPTGGVFRGRIESKLGPFALQVVDNELRACPFVVRLDDGRVALVDDAALVLESNEDSLGVGSEVELTGNPTLTPYAPEGYRGASALRFQGEYSAPVGIRALDSFETA